MCCYIPDIFNLLDCRRNRLIDVGGLTVYLPVHVIADLFQNPDILQLHQRNPRFRQSQEIRNLGAFFNVYHLVLLSIHNSGIHFKFPQNLLYLQSPFLSGTDNLQMIRLFRITDGTRSQKHPSQKCSPAATALNHQRICSPLVLHQLLIPRHQLDSLKNPYRVTMGSHFCQIDIALFQTCIFPDTDYCFYIKCFFQ